MKTKPRTKTNVLHFHVFEGTCDSDKTNVRYIFGEKTPDWREDKRRTDNINSINWNKKIASSQNIQITLFNSIFPILFLAPHKLSTFTKINHVTSVPVSPDTTTCFLNKVTQSHLSTRNNIFIPVHHVTVQNVAGKEMLLTCKCSLTNQRRDHFTK